MRTTNAVAPPAAGSWVRSRWLPRMYERKRSRLEPEWDGMWHLATGDLRMVAWSGTVFGKSRCGHEFEVTMKCDWQGEAFGDIVVSATIPTVEVCSRCCRLSGRFTVEPPLEAIEREYHAAVAEAERLRRLRLAGALPPPG